MRVVLLLMCLLCSLDASSAVVKQSSSGICHDTNSPHYASTKNFNAFDTLAACLKKGGRLPKQNTVSLMSDGFNRAQWGVWQDEDHDCQNTRAEVLQRDSRTQVRFADAQQCVVLAGRWFAPYSGQRFEQAKELDIDHIIPLAYAHAVGASAWPQEKKQQFANDPDNLIAVSASANRSKGAKGPSQWMPQNQAYVCTYLGKWRALAQKYQLELRAEDGQFIQRSAQLAGCNPMLLVSNR